MSVNASAISGLFDAAASVVLRGRGLSYTEDHTEPGVAVPRKGVPYWETSGDFDWEFRVTYQTQGVGPFSVIVWASNGPGVPDVPVASISIPANNAGETRGLISAASLRAIPSDQPLYLSVALSVASGSLDAGCVLARVS